MTTTSRTRISSEPHMRPEEKRCGPRYNEVMKHALLILVLLFAGCDNHAPVEVERSKARTDGAMPHDAGFVEVERRAVGDKVFVKFENATELRWVEIADHGLGMSRVMSRDERIPR